MRRAVDDRDLVAASDDAGHDHAEVGAWGTAFCKAAHPELFLEPGRKRAARDAGRGDLEDAVATDLPALANERAVDIETHGGEVLAEDAAGERPSELGLPEVEVLAGEGVDRLIRPAMGARITDQVAGKAAPTRARAGVADEHRRSGRTLVDAGDAAVVVTGRGSMTEVHREQSGHDSPTIAPAECSANGVRRVAVGQ